MATPENMDQALVQFAQDYDVAIEALTPFITTVCTVLTDLGVDELNWFPPEDMSKIVIEYGLNSEDVRIFLKRNHQKIGSPEHMALLTMQGYVWNRFAGQKDTITAGEDTRGHSIMLYDYSVPTTNGTTLVLTRFLLDEQLHTEMIFDNGKGVQRSISLRSDPNTETFRRYEHPPFFERSMDLEAYKRTILTAFPQAEYINLSKVPGLNPLVRRPA